MLGNVGAQLFFMDLASFSPCCHNLRSIFPSTALCVLNGKKVLHFVKLILNFCHFFIFCSIKESNNELEKERDNLNAELSKSQLNGIENNEALKKSNKELEDKLCKRTEELDESKEKLEAHDQAAKRAIAALQKEMALRVDQVSKKQHR